MIIQNNNNPVNSLYYIGYKFLSWIKENDKSVFDLSELYEHFNITLEKKINFAKFLLLMDWLHLNNCLDIEEDGNVRIHVFN